MAKKRIRLADLRRHDLTRDDQVVRELEMVADGAISSPGYGIQFWKDVSLYGVDEAILYVRNSNHGNADEIQSAWEEIRKRL